MNKHDEAYEFLSDHTVGVLSSASSSAEPWGAVIYYVVDEKLNFYFLTHAETKKYTNLKENALAAVTVADNEHQATVQAYGSAEELTAESKEISEAFRKLAAVHPPGELKWTPPVSKTVNGEVAIFKVSPKILQLSRFSEGQASIKQII